MLTPKRKLMLLLGALATGTVFQVQPAGCSQYTAQVAISAVNVCSIINCSGSSFFNFCNPQPIFVDCE